MPEHNRTNAMRSRWFGSMLACTLKTKPVMSSSAAVTSRLSADCARGGGATAPSASSRSLTPKFLSALPKNTGVKCPSRNDAMSKRLHASRTRSNSPWIAVASRLGLSAATSGIVISSLPGKPVSPSSRRTFPVSTSIVPTKSRPRPIGQVIGALSSASVFSISSSRSNGSRLSRSILLMKVTIGISRSRQTSNSLRVRASMPFAASITMTAESTAVSVR